MKVYVVQVTPEASFSKVSQEGCLSFEAAQKFIASRYPKPEPIDPSNPWRYRDAEYTEYEICEVDV